MDPPSVLPPSSIPYADLAARWGISVSRDAQSLRIVIPPSRRIRDLPIGYKIGVPYLLLGSMAPIFSMMGNGRTIPLPDLLIHCTIYFGLLGLILFFAARRLFGQRVIELDGRALSISWLFGSRPFHKRSWPRERIGVVKRNISTGQLVIYVTGYTLADVYISRDPQLAEWVAGEITAALQSLPAHVANLSDTPPGYREEFPQPMPKGRARSLLLAVSGVLSVCAMILLPFGPPWAGVSYFLFIFAAIPAGAALGMQDKNGQYWF